VAQLLMTGLAQIMALEGALGVTTGHAAAVAYVDAAIDRLEGGQALAPMLGKS
jgi:hypothetical protein